MVAIKRTGQPGVLRNYDRNTAGEWYNKIQGLSPNFESDYTFYERKSKDSPDLSGHIRENVYEDKRTIYHP